MKARRVRRTIGICLLFLFLFGLGIGFYLGSYYPADARALAVLEEPSSGVTVIRTEKRIDFLPAQVQNGLIFYPGGKVQFEAYAPLMEALAARGTLCVLLRMPGNLAVLDPNAADGVREAYPEVEHWFLGGHSLGGTIASFYLASHTEEYEGLLLLASYSMKDLSDRPLRVLSIYGSEDGVLNREEYEAARALLPEDAEELILSGGCHAYFGSYGQQAGDGEARISNQEQIQITADAAAAFLGREESPAQAA